MPNRNIITSSVCVVGQILPYSSVPNRNPPGLFKFFRVQILPYSSVPNRNWGMIFNLFTVQILPYSSVPNRNGKSGGGKK